jgi:tRNA pseudouridine38-40 synthase
VARILLTIAYDGRAFRGWQSQADGRGIQDTLEAALERIARSPIRLHAAGRTDTGVHALGQTAHFDAPASLEAHPAEMWLRALNAHLEPQVRILAAEAVPEPFHARFSAVGKIYDYRIYTGVVLPPLLHGQAWHVPQVMDRALLEQACRLVEGRHDFAAFAANRGDARDTAPGYAIRTLWSVSLRQEPCQLILRFHGEGFLYKMVRLLVGALVRVAQRRESLAWLTERLYQPNLGKCSYVAPADGLYLEKVCYPD